MNTEQQRIAIAEACGWTECRLIKSYDGEQIPYGVAPNESPILNETPDYLNDLNAMHEAEKTLPDHMHARYFVCLTATVSSAITLGGHFYSVSATAPQRAEAFLKTIGKWEGASHEHRGKRATIAPH